MRDGVVLAHLPLKVLAKSGRAQVQAGGAGWRRLEQCLFVARHAMLDQEGAREEMTAKNTAGRLAIAAKIEHPLARTEAFQSRRQGASIATLRKSGIYFSYSIFR